MTTGLSGGSTIVTDAEAGIGRAVALQLPAGGVNVIVHGRDGGSGDTLARQITVPAQALKSAP